MALLFGRGAAHLLVRAVFVVFYGAGADEDICAVDTAGKQGQSKEVFLRVTSDNSSVCQ